MNIFHKCKLSILVCSLSLSTFFSAPALAAETEDPAVASENRYNLEIQSNSWESWPAGPQIYAETAVVMEASTGTVLYNKSMDQQMYPASITKIMTVLLALENLDLSEEVTFSHNAVFSIDYNSSHIARDEGEVLTVEECLYAILLESANECSNAIAEHTAGSVEAFAEMMNQRAAELGCTNTHFTNPHGLPDENHYTTAHDMALIAREAIKYDKFRQISNTPRYTLRATNKKSEELLMNNHHYMISNYKTSKYLDDTVFAGKNGYTTVALNTLVTCASRNGMDLIVVTMKTQGGAERGVPVYTDTASLLNYASENFHKVNIAENETNFSIGQSGLFDTGSTVFGSPEPMIELDPEGNVILPVTAEFTDASPKLEFLDAEDGQNIATLSYTYAGQHVGSTNLYLTGNTTQEHDFQNEEDANSQDATDNTGKSGKEEVRLIKINLRDVGIAVFSTLLAAVVIFLTIRIAKDHDIDINPISRWRTWRNNKNSFLNGNRKRYRSRKRNRRWK